MPSGIYTRTATGKIAMSIARSNGLRSGKIKIWNKGLNKHSDTRVYINGLKTGISRRKLIAEGKIKIWDEGLTKYTDERVKNLGIKIGNTVRGKKYSDFHKQRIRDGLKAKKLEVRK